MEIDEKGNLLEAVPGRRGYEYEIIGKIELGTSETRIKEDVRINNGHPVDAKKYFPTAILEKGLYQKTIKE